VFNLNLWMHTLVELWSWNRSHNELCDRSDSPWDDPERPSHANRRKALRQLIMHNESSTLTATWWLPQKIINLPNASWRWPHKPVLFSESAELEQLRQNRMTRVQSMWGIRQVPDGQYVSQLLSPSGGESP
jgi:hypothetical protein